VYQTTGFRDGIQWVTPYLLNHKEGREKAHIPKETMINIPQIAVIVSVLYCGPKSCKAG